MKEEEEEDVNVKEEEEEVGCSFCSERRRGRMTDKEVLELKEGEIGDLMNTSECCLKNMGTNATVVELCGFKRAFIYTHFI